MNPGLNNLSKNELNYENKAELFIRRNLDDLNFNYLMFDFVDYYPCLIQYIIYSNIDKKLEIHKASFAYKDCTDFVRKLITRGNCLYIPNLLTEFGLRKDEISNKKLCWFEIAYSYDNGPKINKDFDLAEGCPILIGYEK